MTTTFVQHKRLALKVIDRNGNNIYANYNKELDLRDTNLHSKVYNHLCHILQNKQEMDIINEAYDIGFKINDKIIVLTNLFFLCIRRGRVSLMQRIIGFVKHRCAKNANEYISYIINAFDRNYTPIMRAASNCSIACIRLLLIWGADINTININGEDVFAAAKYGYEMRCKEFANYELFETKKYNETIRFIKYWKENGSILHDDLQKEEHDLIDVDQNIDEQIDKILLQCLEDTNEGKLKLLFEEIANKNIKISKEILSKYEDELKDEFPSIIF